VANEKNTWRPAVRQILRNQSRVMRLKVNHVDPNLSKFRYAVRGINIMRNSALPASVRVLHRLALNVQVHCSSWIKMASHCCFPWILLYFRNFTSSKKWYPFRQWDSYVNVLTMKQRTNTVSVKVCLSLSFVNAWSKRSNNHFADPRSATEYARLCLYLSKYHGISKASFLFEPISSVFMHKTTQGPVLDLGYSMTSQIEQRTPEKVNFIFIQ